MIPFKLTVALIAAIAVFFILIIIFLKYRRLELKYTLLWLLTGIVMLILVLRPDLMRLLTSLAGIQSNMNGLFLFILAFVIMILMSLTSICSGLNERIRELVQTEALTEKRLRDLEKMIEELKKES